ncbi:hypothetical protein HWV62_39892 [Athelia sp. TMB]|nr:hypothetical protein HWV62_39892 [Athelia sp. TMB]
MTLELDDSLLDDLFEARDDNQQDIDIDADDSDSGYDDMVLPDETDEEPEPEHTDAQARSAKITAGPAISVENTQGLKERLSGSLVNSMHRVLDALAMEGMNLPLFLDALSWGTPECVRDPRIRYARSSLMHSEELPVILRHWWKPPRTEASNKSRPKGAKLVMESFAAEVARHNLSRELDNIAASFSSPGEEDITEETLTSFSFGRIVAETQLAAPRLWQLLRELAYTPQQQKRNTHKNPDKIVLMTISQLSYTRSHRRNRLQKMLAIYLKFRGLSAKGFDTLHYLAITMSHKWTGNAVSRISKRAMDEMVGLMEIYPWFISHDNVQIPFRVFSQRLDNQGEFGNGTAATIYIKRNSQPLPEDVNAKLKEFRARGMMNPLTELDISDIADESYHRVVERITYQVLSFLLRSPEFDLQTYVHKDSPALEPPPPVKGLPSGRDNTTLIYLLGTVNIPEASYEDHDRLIEEWYKQIKWDTMSKQVEVATKKILAWIGDQLTVDRLRGLFKFRAEDLNSFERNDYMVLMFGWLHFQMAFANSLHKQYLGTSGGRGFRQAFDILNRKGLLNVLTKGPFHQNLDEALYHIAEAHIREDWLIVGRVEKLADLRSRTPEQLVDLARRLVREFASTEALDDMEMKPSKNRDEQRRLVTQRNRDLLQYIVLDQAIHHGDVGLMEDMLPHLFFRFIASNNTKYAVECLEVMQGKVNAVSQMHELISPTVSARDFLQEHCWLVNTVPDKQKRQVPGTNYYALPTLSNPLFFHSSMLFTFNLNYLHEPIAVK